MLSRSVLSSGFAVFIQITSAEGSHGYLKSTSSNERLMLGKDDLSRSLQISQQLLDASAILYAPEEKAQESAMTSFYYALNGPSWDEQQLWLSNSSVCEWYNQADPEDICDEDLFLEYLIIEDNNLRGTLPSEISGLIALQELDLEDNQISGPIPSTVGLLSNLEELDLSKNDMTGTIPVQLGNLDDLDVLDLSDNNFAGSIPSSFGQLVDLEFLDVGDNQLTGTLSADIFLLPEMEEIILEFNGFSGTLPTEIGLSTTLKMVNLESNDFYGSLPSEFGNVANLEVLNIASNDFTGAVPIELTQLVNLTSLNLNDTDLVGTIPQDLCELEELIFECNPGEGLCGCDCDCDVQEMPDVVVQAAEPEEENTESNSDVQATERAEETTESNSVAPGSIYISQPLGDVSCFSADMTVTAKGKGTPVMMRDVEVGEYVLTASGSYSPVYAFAHHHPFWHAEFIQIETNTSKHEYLQMTAEHLVFLHGTETGPVRAYSLQVGDVLLSNESGPLEVTRLERIKKNGIYAPLTEEGTIVVNGVAASCYISFQKEGNGYIRMKLFGQTWLSQHTFVHVVLSPFRLVCSNLDVFGACTSYNQQGMPSFVAFGIDLISCVLESQSFLFQFLAMAIMLAVTGIVYVVEQRPATCFLLGGGAFACWSHFAAKKPKHV